MTNPHSQRVIDHYSPLLREFTETVRQIPLPFEGLMPEPFLPHFGRSYFQSPMRLAFIGQDTYYWGDLREFLADPGADQGERYLRSLADFQNHKFRSWAGSRYDFHGFILWFLAALHRQENWTTMKQGAMSEILDSFAWGNLNAVELYGSTVPHDKVTWELWEQVRAAAEPLNCFSHVVETLAPRVALILCRGLNPDSYFAGLDYEIVSTQGRLTHYRILQPRIDVFNAPHPSNMKFSEGADHFRETLESIFHELGVHQVFPEFLAGQVEGAASMDYLRTHAPDPGPDFDKFAFIAWVAEELIKQKTFMAVPALCDLLNERGYRTNYGDTYTAGRGSYRLLSAAYARMERSATPEKARHIAVAFRRPNFEYAYSCD